MTRWIRNRPGPREELLAAVTAAAAGAAIGAGVFYVARLLLAREPLPPSGASSAASDAVTGRPEDGT